MVVEGIPFLFDLSKVVQFLIENIDFFWRKGLIVFLFFLLGQPSQEIQIVISKPLLLSLRLRYWFVLYYLTIRYSFEISEPFDFAVSETRNVGFFETFVE